MLILFSMTITVGAFLLFLVQPMVAKPLLPVLGGTPAVWNTAMLVFQALLLAGYGYIHLLAKQRRISRQWLIHSLLLVLSLFWLPLTVAIDSSTLGHLAPSLWLMMTLVSSVALPFLVLAANSPLVQLWFGQLPHHRAENPYFLYAASNIGSFMALVAYPVLVEPSFTIREQMQLWSVLFGGYLLLISACGYTVWKQRHATFLKVEHHATLAGANATPIAWAEKLRWLLLSFLPSSLLLGVTTYLTTDLAPMPLLWMVPLGLYLLTFVLAFSHRRDTLFGGKLRQRVVVMGLLVLALGHIALTMQELNFLLHLTGFFLLAYLCHDQLARRAPDKSHLSAYYFWLSLGGVLGALFNTLIAPLIFDTVLEYPLLLLLATLLVPQQWGVSAEKKRDHWIEITLPLLFFMSFLLMYWLWAIPNSSMRQFYTGLVEQGFLKQINMTPLAALMLSVLVGVLPLAYGMYRWVWLRVALGLGLAALMIYISLSGSWVLYRERNFYGTLAVMRDEDKNANLMLHGTTLHGLQSKEEEFRLKPVSYYATALEESLRYFPTSRVAVVGLGAGIVLCHGKEGDRFDLFEINPAVIHAAENPKWFTYLRDCPPDHVTYEGDARLKLAEVEDASYDVMIMDAYSSDSLPLHLLTNEAMQLYLSKLKPDGALLFHISNRHLDLRPVLNRLAQENGLLARHRSTKERNPLEAASSWMVLTRNDARLAELTASYPEWKTVTPVTRRLWTDDYTPVLEIMDVGNIVLEGKK
jgi:spermidine synthase